MTCGGIVTAERNSPGSPGAEREPDAATQRRLVRTHFLWGWWSLLAFLVLGIFLDALHGFKAGFYLDASSETRRLMWTLAHAHGALLALVHLALAGFLNAHAGWPDRSRTVASRALMGGSVLLPGGFFLGGLFPYDGDPGLGVYLVPVGALLLLVAVLLAARSARRMS